MGVGVEMNKSLGQGGEAGRVTRTKKKKPYKVPFEAYVDWLEDVKTAHKASWHDTSNPRSGYSPQVFGGINANFTNECQNGEFKSVKKKVKTLEEIGVAQPVHGKELYADIYRDERWKQYKKKLDKLRKKQKKQRSEKKNAKLVSYFANGIPHKDVQRCFSTSSTQ